MVSRDDVLSRAANDCMKELYSLAQPSINWEDFKKECETYSKKYREWEDWKRNNTSHPEWEGKSITECIGPKPYEFYYLPRDIMKEVCQSYVDAYNIDAQQELLNIISILKDYCKRPIVDKYIDEHTDENGNWHPGYRSYDNPDNLEKEITKILGPEAEDNPYHVHKICDKFFEFLDMAGNFYNWNRDLNSFNITVYLGPSPNSNKEAVIENWKRYRNKDIEINEEQIRKEFYGEDFDE